MFKLLSVLKINPIRWLIFPVVLATLVACAPLEPERIVETIVETQIVEVEVEVEKKVEVLITPTPEPEIKEGGTLIFATNLRAEFPINPVIAFNRPGLWMFDALTELDAETTQPKGNLAESWDVSDDGQVYTFHLRQDVTWHDGETFDADDVMFTFDRWLNDPSSSMTNLFTFTVDGEGVPASIEKIDDFTVEITLPKPSSLFLNNLCCWRGIVPEHLLSGIDDLGEATEFNENPVGTGVLVFDELRSQEFVRFNMNKDYWRGRPHLDEFIWQVIPDDDAQITALSNGEIDVMKNVNTVDSASRIATIPGVTIYDTLGNFTYAFWFNQEQFEPFQDIAVREAIAMALDKPTIMPNVIGAPYADQIFNPSYWGYNGDAPVVGYDVEGAIARLADAGWTDTDGDGVVDKDGQPLSFTVMTERTLLPEAIQGYLSIVGIDIQINEVERAVRRELQGTGEWQAYIGWDGSGVPFSAMLSNWVSGKWSKYNNPNFDELVIQADEATDANERASLVQEAVKTLTEDTAAVWLYYYTTRIAVSDNVKGILLPGSTADLNNTGVFYHLEDLYMLDPK